MAAVPPKVFTIVDTTADDLFDFIAKSKDLVDEYVKIAGDPNPVVTSIKCATRSDVNKVFSHSIRAFLAWKDLDYKAAEPDASDHVGDKDFTRAKPVSDDLSQYEGLSEAVVVRYAKIIGNSNVRTVDCPCTDVENVKKVFSHSARAFLKWEDLKYTPDEPGNPSV